MLEIPEPLKSRILKLGNDIALDSDLHEKGREDWPHITVKYGLHTNDDSEVWSLVRSSGRVRFRIGVVSKFESEDFDVIKLSVESDDLSKMRSKVEVLENTDSHPQYHPHITLAYAKKGTQLRADVIDNLTGKWFEGDTLVFSTSEEEKTRLRLSEAREKSTATEWLLEHADESLDEIIFDTPYGRVPMGFMTDFPQWMKDSIEERLIESFDQDYWPKINDTTGGQIDTVLQNGLKEGWSISRMAEEISSMLDDFSEARARNIARTESGNALNGARVAAIDALQADIGDRVPFKKTWLSVLGTTTRRTHADLDGVPADKDGMWYLGGVRVRWPGDVNLPPGERCFCQCSVIVEWGMVDFEADERIAEYELRLAEQGKSFLGLKVYCPTGPAGRPGIIQGREDP